MTVLEYIKIINGVLGDNQLTTDMIKTTGFIDAVPSVGDISCMNMSGTKYFINDGALIAKRSFDIGQKNDIELEKSTPLNDDVALHCGENGTVERLLQRTIKTLTAANENSIETSKFYGTQPIDYESRINAFYDVLENMKSNDMGSM